MFCSARLRASSVLLVVSLPIRPRPALVCGAVSGKMMDSTHTHTPQKESFRGAISLVCLFFVNAAQCLLYRHLVVPKQTANKIVPLCSVWGKRFRTPHAFVMLLYSAKNLSQVSNKCKFSSVQSPAFGPRAACSLWGAAQNCMISAR